MRRFLCASAAVQGRSTMSSEHMRVGSDKRPDCPVDPTIAAYRPSLRTSETVPEFDPQREVALEIVCVKEHAVAIVESGE